MFEPKGRRTRAIQQRAGMLPERPRAGNAKTWRSRCLTHDCCARPVTLRPHLAMGLPFSGVPAIATRAAACEAAPAARRCRLTQCLISVGHCQILRGGFVKPVGATPE